MVWICWSFAALQHGYHPTHDPEGKPLKKDSPFFIEKGKPLAHGLCKVLWVVQGDHEFFSILFTSIIEEIAALYLLFEMHLGGRHPYHSNRRSH